MLPSDTTDILVYQDNIGRARVDVRLRDEMLWLTAGQIAEIFQTSNQNIGQHIANIYDERELEEETTTLLLTLPRAEGARTVRRTVIHYSLDVVISVGYRVSSKTATRFRQWATAQLLEYASKGFVIDSERLKNPGEFGTDYFDELLEQIREIRASEKRFYQKVRDIFTTAIDYDKHDETARRFFQLVQNKLLFAVTGFTAAELIHSRANRHEANMGLQSWSGQRVRRTDVSTGKNYLSNDELEQLDRLVEQYLNLAEARAQRKISTTMQQWEELLDSLLKLNVREVLENFGEISMEVAKAMAQVEYDAFDEHRHELEDARSTAEDIKELTEFIDSLPDEDPS